MSSTTSASNGASQSGSSGSSSASTSSIPQSAPAGLLSMTQPPQASTSFFKIASGEVVTFAWSFSGVLATPTSLTVNAVGANSFTYSLTSLPGTASSYIWTPYDYQQSHLATPLAQTTYSLQIFDDRGLGATTRPGYLSPNTALTFALYTPQPYTPLASWDCTVCSGSNSSFTAHPAYVALIATFLVMFLSGFGLLRNAVAYTRR
ncbi:MAG: hypothetical protein NXY57DRAFT_1004862 [Lentinula lateritia]|uniref:DUF7137 domain-containing protein n=1 Tax=Lentinula lateritia TaxID=40482 RepID=A0ABQ8VIF2_9AGAR|nr:MAG: hypothetical protein NXY57DRAFT_1004862 [Lentinula lateritia]KAJ4495422.1 hypothetical protein C8R41DRAFT_827920 [Lentinula lateritia]